MFRLRKFLSLMAIPLIGTAILLAPTPAHANFEFIIRATEYGPGGGSMVATETATSGVFVGSNPGAVLGSLSASFDAYTIAATTNIGSTGPGFSSASTTINVGYTGTSGDSLLIEVLAWNLPNPTVGTQAVITSNGSPSTTGLAASVIMQSGVLATSTNAFGSNTGTIATTIANMGSQLGQTTGSGSMGGASSILVPNPVTGAVFAIPGAGSVPYSFYQSYQFTGPTNNGTGSLSAGSTVLATPAPAGLLLVLTGLPALGIRWLRRHKTVQPA